MYTVPEEYDSLKVSEIPRRNKVRLSSSGTAWPGIVDPSALFRGSLTLAAPFPPTLISNVTSGLDRTNDVTSCVRHGRTASHPESDFAFDDVTEHR